MCLVKVDRYSYAKSRKTTKVQDLYVTSVAIGQWRLKRVEQREVRNLEAVMCKNKRIVSAHIITMLPRCPDKRSMRNAVDRPIHEIFDCE